MLVAIYIVERYTENLRREAQRKEAEREEAQRIQWLAYIHGGVAFHANIVLKVCLFSIHGKNRLLDLLEVEGDTSDVPETVGDFIAWCVERLEPGSDNWAYIDLLKDDDESRAVVERQMALIRKTFSEPLPTGIAYSIDDLSNIERFFTHIGEQLADQFLLSQPFAVTHMDFGVNLVMLRRNVDRTAQIIRRRLTGEADLPSLPDVWFRSDERLAGRFLPVARIAADVLNLIRLTHRNQPATH